MVCHRFSNQNWLSIDIIIPNVIFVYIYIDAMSHCPNIRRVLETRIGHT